LAVRAVGPRISAVRFTDVFPTAILPSKFHFTKTLISTCGMMAYTSRLAIIVGGIGESLYIYDIGPGLITH
jgi:hypothetical protein